MAKDITPEHLRCSLGGCPSVHVLDDGRLEITGEYARVISKDDGPDEAVVRIGEEYFSELPEVVRLREALSETLEWIKLWEPNFIYDDEWQATRDKIDAALSKGKETT